MRSLRTNCYSIDNSLPLAPVRLEVLDYLLDAIPNAHNVDLGPNSISIPIPGKRRPVRKHTHYPPPS